MSETSSPSIITVGRGKKSHFDEHEQDKHFIRSEAANAAGAQAPGPRPAVPDSEVVARPHRRRFTAEYKRSIIDQADGAKDAGAVGALLRREGLYSSHLTTWRRQQKQGELDALAPKKRGPKVVVSPLVKENRELQAANARLIKKLKNAELIIEVQKKWLVRRDKTGMG
jgi:transposase